MTNEDLEFYYFSAHDFDKNSKLDGLELLKVRFYMTLGEWMLTVLINNLNLFFQSIYHTSDHEAPDPDADSSIEPEANDLEEYIGR